MKTKSHTYLLATLLLVSAIVSTAFAGARTRTTRGKLQAQARTELSHGVASIDTIVPGKQLVSVARYDKPLLANKEAFTIENLTSATDTVVALAITIDYTDMSGVQLHRRSCRVRNLLIPPGHTRTASVVSWDKQKSYYYHLSGAGRTARRVTPYDVAISVDTVFVKHKSGTR